ncbi:MAG: peptide deformylase [Clostridiales bacterium]|nr:peptide deformylase [Clostridiales bacterium]
MGLRNILQGTDPTLRKQSRIVKDFNSRLHKLLDDMRETMKSANGLGLAAPQVGVLRRAVLVVDTSRAQNEGDDECEECIIELVNPKIIVGEGEQDGSEGCLSLPGVYGMVKRPMNVMVRAQDRYGEPIEIWGRGLTARALCHEINHLDGILFADLATRFLTEEELEEMATKEFEDSLEEDDEDAAEE